MNRKQAGMGGRGLTARGLAARVLPSLALAVVAAGTPIAVARGQESAAARAYRESYRLEATRDYAGALAKVRQARQGGGDAYFAALRAGWLQYLAGDYAASAASYGEAAAANPRSIEARLGRTLPLLALGNWRELERGAREVLALDPNHMTALGRLAAAQYNLGNFADAAASYRKLVEGYPAELDYRTGLGWALLKQGRTAEARTLFEGVLAVSPDNLSALAGVGRR